MTRLAVPVVSEDGLSSKVNDHFGMSEYFAILGVEGDRIASIGFIRNEAVKESEKKTSLFLADRGVDVVLAGRIGSCNIKPLLDRGIKLFTNAEGTVQDAFEDYKAGKLNEVLTAGYTL